MVGPKSLPGGCPEAAAATQGGGLGGGQSFLSLAGSLCILSEKSGRVEKKKRGLGKGGEGALGRPVIKTQRKLISGSGDTREI